MKKEKDLDTLINDQLVKITKEIDKGMGNLIKTGSLKQKALDKDVKSIKEACSSFFEQYD